MHNVEQRTTRNQERHDDDVGLHDGGWYGRRKLSERIAGEHGKRLPDASSVLERPNCQPSAGYGGPGRACIAFLPCTASCGEPRRRTLAVTLDAPNATVGEMPLLIPDRQAHMYHVVSLVRIRGTPGDA